MRFTARISALRSGRQLMLQGSVLLLAALLATQSPLARACGGFFCQNLPIDQAGEQIVFRQDEGTITAMVRILYSGAAEDFSWVVPVPDTPEISLGADTTFDELDLLTRPRFILERRGESCPVDVSVDADSGAEGGSPTAGESGVNIEQELEVGPFDIVVLSSDNPDELATWLTDNGYDLTDRGRDLIEPYVLDGMKFVALKLRSGEETGSIQPLIMRYPSDKPMVPIRLTAIAAQDDMGVLIWTVADGRMVPDNYLHVTPNYTRLNWYTGENNAYASYQALITEAMDESGGQGFATDFAGPVDDRLASLSTAEQLEQQLSDLDRIGNDAEYIVASLSLGSTSRTLALLETVLPLPDGQSNDIYFDAAAMSFTYTTEELASARARVRESLLEREVEPLRQSVELLSGDRYLTRLYTTLSADEMTLDPTFEINATMAEQPRERNAVLESRCGANGTEWTLTLGAGTGRDGETVLAAKRDIPFSAPPEVAEARDATWQRALTRGDAAPEVLYQESLATLDIDPDVGGSSDDDDGFLGAASGMSGVLMALLGWRMRRALQQGALSRNWPRR